MQTGIMKFHGQQLLTAKDTQSGKVYVAMKPIVEGMGLNWGSQIDKMRNDSRYTLISIPFKTNRGTQEMLSLPTDQLAGYLYSINPNKVKRHLRDRIIAYQQETFTAINDYWTKGHALNPRQSADPHPDLALYTQLLEAKDALLAAKEQSLSLQAQLIETLSVHAQHAARSTRPRTSPKYFISWSEDEDTQLLSLRAQGYTYPYIAQQLERTKDSVKNRCKRLKARQLTQAGSGTDDQSLRDRSSKPDPYRSFVSSLFGGGER